ncbi:MAG TPA: hypothetical protein VGC45_15670 [Gryllotalpicola sp.]
MSPWDHNEAVHIIRQLRAKKSLPRITGWARRYLLQQIVTDIGRQRTQEQAITQMLRLTSRSMVPVTAAARHLADVASLATVDAETLAQLAIDAFHLTPPRGEL